MLEQKLQSLMWLIGTHVSPLDQCAIEAVLKVFNPSTERELKVCLIGQYSISMTLTLYVVLVTCVLSIS